MNIPRNSSPSKAKSATGTVVLLLIACCSVAGQTTPLPYVFQSLSPASALSGSVSITNFTIYGAGFSSSSTVNFVVGTVACGVTSVAESGGRKITATIPSSCLATPGTATVSVTNPVGTSNVVFFPIPKATSPPTFTAKSPITVPTGPLSIVAADFNKDGKLDLAIGSGATAGTSQVTVLLGNGDGTFQTAHSYAVGNFPYGITVGDFNKDGNLDIATANEGAALQNAAGSVSILSGIGAGVFGTATSVLTGDTPYAVVAGDFNCDGYLDLVTINNNGGGVSVIPGGSSGFTTAYPAFSECGTGTTNCTAISAIPGDFDNNGVLDLAVLDWNQGGSAVGATGGGSQIALVQGTCTTTQNPLAMKTVLSKATLTGLPVPIPPDITAFALGNFNGDTSGDLDIEYVSSSNVSGGIQALLGAGSFTASTWTEPTATCAGAGCSTPAYPNALGVGDFNGDGKLDLAVASGNFPAGAIAGTGIVSVLQGNQTGVFVGRGDSTNVGSMATALAVGDFNNDGKLDVAVINYSSSTMVLLLHN